jgi:hypothetical protein
MDEQRVIWGRRVMPSLGFSSLQYLKDKLRLGTDKSDSARSLTSHIHTSKTAAAISNAVSPHLLRTNGLAPCFVRR